MADEKGKKTQRLTGKIKNHGKQGIKYIAPDIEVFLTPSSISSNNTVEEGDRVEFTLKFNDKNSQFEAIDVVPVKLQCFNCKNYGHIFWDCPFQVRVSCFKCGEIGHFAWDCGKEKSPRLFNNGGSLLGSTSNSKSSVVSVKKKEDVKRVEKVEDCFVLEFDPTKIDNDGEDDDDDDDDDDDCRIIVCVKNVEDVKKVEEVEDCFILEFDPNQPIEFGNLSLCDDDDVDDVSIVAEKGKVACRDYPHPRNLCVTHHFQTTPHEIHCKMCYCYVCEEPAPCKRWTKGLIESSLRHCDATGDDQAWSRLKELMKEQNRIEGKI